MNCPAFMESCPDASIGDIDDGFNKCLPTPNDTQVLKICIEKRYMYNDTCKNDTFAKKYITCSDPDDIVDQFVKCYDKNATGEYIPVYMPERAVDIATESTSDDSGWHFSLSVVDTTKATVLAPKSVVETTKATVQAPTICGSRFADPNSTVWTT